MSAFVPRSSSDASHRPTRPMTLSAAHLIFFPVLAGLIIGVAGWAYNSLPSHHAYKETLQGYHDLAKRVDGSVRATRQLLGTRATEPDLALLGPNRKPAREPVRTTADIAQAFLDLKIEGIMERRGIQLAIVNNELVELNQVVAGVTVRSIKDDQITVVDEQGKEHVFSIYAKLDQYRGTPQEPLIPQPSPKKP